VSELNIQSRQWSNTLIPRSRTVGCVAYTVFVWSRLSAPVELSTHYRCKAKAVGFKANAEAEAKAKNFGLNFHNSFIGTLISKFAVK